MKTFKFGKCSKWHLAFLIITLSAFSNAFAQYSQNHLKGDLRVHDPAMIKDGNTYYVYSTGMGIPFKTSKDMIHWKNAGRVFTKKTTPKWFTKDIPEQKGDVWAPDIHYYKGKYYLYYAVSAWMNFNSSIGLATNTTLDPNNPAYKWVDQGQVISYKNGGKGVNVIDPNVFIDKDGKVWLVYGSYKAGVRLTQLNPKNGLLQNNPPKIIKLTNGLGEGSFIIKGPKYYYLFVSRGRCCAGLKSTYQVVMGRATKIEGPYLNKKGESMLDNKYSLFLAGDYQEPGRGGNSFFTEGDTTYIVYHAYTRSAHGMPLLNIKPVYMNKDGWPTMNSSNPLFKRTIY